MTVARPDKPPTRGRAPRVPNVVRDESLAGDVDWSAWYLTDEEDMGQSPVQFGAIRWGVEPVEVRVAELGWADALVGSDAFFAWLRVHPLVRVSPDVYVLVNPPEPLPKSFQTWRPGHRAPVLAIEVVSDDWRKDYEEAPQKYAMLGTDELILFDPEAATGAASGPERVPLQVFRRTDDGLFVRGEAGPGPIRCRTLACFVVVASTPTGPGFRLAYDAAGTELVPTRAERAEGERAVAEAERAQAEAERAQAEAERAQAQSERAQAQSERAQAEAERDAERAARRALEQRLLALEERPGDG